MTELFLCLMLTNLSDWSEKLLSTGVQIYYLICSPEMEVTEIILLKISRLFSCRVTVVDFFLGYRFLNS
jgi:hypothetical protein